MPNVYIEVSEKDDEAKGVLVNFAKSAQWIQDLQLWSIDSKELSLFPELKGQKQYDLKEARERAQRIKIAQYGIRHTYSEMEELNHRVYLDFVPKNLARWISNPDNGFKYDPIEHQYYCDASLIEGSALYRDRVARCQRPKPLTGLDINSGKPTRGKTMLAIALNETDPAKRELFLARALNECAKEKAMRKPGCVNNYNEILHACAKAGVNLGYRASYEQSQNFYSAVRAFKEANGTIFKSTRGAELQEKLAVAESKANLVLLRNGAENLEASIDDRFHRLSKPKALNRDVKENLAIVAKCCSDHAMSVALLANAKLSAGKGLGSTDMFERSREKFDKQIDDLLANMKVAYEKNGKDLKEFANFSAQVRLMGKMTHKNCQLLEERAFKNVNELLNTNKKYFTDQQLKEFSLQNLGEASALLEHIQRSNFGLNLINPGFKEVKAKEILKSDKRPLYLVMNREDRLELKKDNLLKEVKLDPYHGAMCVEDTPENREKYAKYLPSPDEFKKMEEYTVELKDQACKHLEKAGIKARPQDLVLDGNVQKIGNVAYKFATFENEPILQIYDQNNANTTEYKLGVQNADKAKLFSEQFAKVMMTKNAMEMQHRVEVADFVNNSYTSKSMVIANDTNLDFPYFKQLGISIKNTGAFIDQKGVYDNSIFAKEQIKTNTTAFFPMFNDTGSVTNSLAIADNGLQQFVGHAPMRGCFGMPLATKLNLEPNRINNALAKAKGILITTDPITASLMQQKAPEGVIVVSAMTSGNLKYVAENLAKKYPNVGIGVIGEFQIKSSDHSSDIKYPGVHDAMHTARVALRNERPFAQAFIPPFSQEEIANGKASLVDLYKADPERFATFVTNASIETLDNQSLTNTSKEMVKEEQKSIAEYLKKHDIDTKKDYKQEVKELEKEQRNLDKGKVVKPTIQATPAKVEKPSKPSYRPSR